jgi:hypothetical protein
MFPSPNDNRANLQIFCQNSGDGNGNTYQNTCLLALIPWDIRALALTAQFRCDQPGERLRLTRSVPSQLPHCENGNVTAACRHE